MIRVQPTRVYVLSAAVLLAVSALGACSGSNERIDRPAETDETDANSAEVLQRYLAIRLSNARACPTGTSRDVQAVVDNARADGLASLPAGCYVIATTIEIPPGTQLVGAGALRTILYRDPDSQRHDFEPILRVKGSPRDPNQETRITGVAVIGARDDNDTVEDYGLTLTDVHHFRVDHSYFEGFGFAAVRVEGSSDGLVDSAIFLDNYKRGIGNLGYGVAVYGTGDWSESLQPGGSQATFVEDSLFIGSRHAVAANAGAHYVFRNNEVLRNVERCAIDAHGMGYGSYRGTQFVEIYRNFIADPVANRCGIGIRGGGGVIFDNTIDGYQNPILLMLESGTPDSLKREYPALDQVQDLYIWDNTSTEGQAKAQTRVDVSAVGFIEHGRDYFSEPRPGYTPHRYPHPLSAGSPPYSEPWPPTDVR